MITNISSILKTESRKKVIEKIFEYPDRQWSCSALEDLTKVSHATVFRTLQALKEIGILKTTRINKKDLIYELSGSPLIEEIKRILNIEQIVTKKITKNFINRIKSPQVYSIILYGSNVKGKIKPDSDIDLLIVLKKKNKEIEEKIYNIAGLISSEVNKTISPVIMDRKEIKRKRNSQFLSSVKNNMEILYGKRPF